MKKTVLITGASTGIGRAAALHFQRQGWQVAATMRTPDPADALARLPDVLCAALDVTRPETIDSALRAALARFGRIDVVVNNAGYGLLGALEATSREQVRRQFDTNVLGLIDVCRAVLPHFRQQRRGVIVNVSSVAGRSTFPLFSSYNASKWAVEGFSESLSHEARLLGVRVKLVEPGAVRSDFYSRSAEVARLSGAPEYGRAVADGVANLSDFGASGASPESVAAVIFRAATDGSRRLRYVVGRDARALLLSRRLLPEPWFFAIVRSIIFKERK